MNVIADLQLHSKYARAVSKDMVVPEIAKWAKKKGIRLIATGDWMHPIWFRELKSKLTEVSDGIFAGAKERQGRSLPLDEEGLLLAKLLQVLRRLLLTT